ncbi:uncharacterized protein C8A04DRAFT_8550 [Dichotomopilus funicola]|uniref:Exonuclease domain-containing protein n=1 Tax=Dichotomopilus funicola TaxID=1934379 RepID=A0AAN6VBC9_9PEZI|nr:hypothetical protein C8A04DRAFT_8550 [Dichotomopilus funicola]
MDAVLRNFKLIPCPAGDRCTKPICPLEHAQIQDSAATTQANGASQDEDGPRKRRKVSSEPDSVPTHAMPSQSEPSSAGRTVSPPPLKRKVPTQAAPVTKSARPPTVSVASPAPTTKPNESSTSPGATPQHTTPQKAAPRKPETLNPRHLKTTAPATHDFRYKALKLLHDQFRRLNDEVKKDASEDEQQLVLSPQELIWLALDEEQKMATEKASIYQNIIKNRIMIYKRMTPGQWRDERAAGLKKKAAPITPPSKTPRRSVLGPPRTIQTGLTPQEEVNFLEHLSTPIDKLAQWGYIPVPPSEAEIAKAREGEEASLGYEVCDRCNTRFQVFPGRREEDGALASGGKCLHHPGRPYYPERSLVDLDRPARRYRCCQQVVGESAGCVAGNTHVFKTSSPARLASVLPFEETPPNPSAPTDRAVCFDCEMGYTVRGLELIRLTATSWPDGKTLLDVLVRPVGEILDLNSRYSGVWPEDIVNAVPWSAEDTNTTIPLDNDGNTNKATDPNAPRRLKIVPSPAAARAALFSLISPDTPLIGHGLENDLNAVRIIHPTLIDTILLYPHRNGMPMRHGLRMLMETRLNKIIQAETDASGKITGHDSAEDARAAGELVRLKVEEKWGSMRGLGWKLVDGKFIAPENEEQGKGKLSEAFLEGGHALAQAHA